MKEFYKDYSEELTQILNKKPALLPRLGNILILLMIIIIISLANFISYPDYIEKDFYNVSLSGKNVSGTINSNSKENVFKIGQPVIIVKSNGQAVSNGKVSNLKFINNITILSIAHNNTKFVTEGNLRIKILIGRKKLLENIWF